MKKSIIYALCIATTAVISSCAIRNDIDYPTVISQITAMEVEGQRGESSSEGSATISTKNNTVTMYVDDSVDLSALQITRLSVSNDATITPDPDACVDADNFPTSSFTSVDELGSSADTRVDFSNPVTFTLHTYQDYIWTVTVTQIVDREIDLENQYGDAIIDETTHVAIVYVTSTQSLSAIKVNTFNLGGEHGTVDPDPTQYDTYDFSTVQTFNVTHAWETEPTEWSVYVYNAENDEAYATASVFAMSTSAYVDGTVSQSSLTPVVQYKANGASSWSEVSSSDITKSGTTFSCQLTGLTPGTKYSLRVNVDDVEGDETTFTTVAAIELTNGGFENWYQSSSCWYPYGESDEPFWGTGNEGSSSFIGNITTPTTESVKGYAVLMETKWAAIKLAAGDIFTGTFEIDGTNGILQFGREFTSFPTGLKFYYQYEMAAIDRIGSSAPEWLEDSKGNPDTCSVYIALIDSDEPYEVRTRPSTRKLFDPTDECVIAYGSFYNWETTTGGYNEVTIPIEYYYKDRTPTYIIIVAASSKYGDYFVGGDGSTMYLDEMELLYE